METWSTTSYVSASTVASHAPNVGMAWLELPQATSSMPGSTSRMALPASRAARPYSAAVLWPICQGPSISLPRHQTLTPYGSDAPLDRRRSDQYVPPGWLAYSTRLRAASTPRVPRLTASIVSMPSPPAQAANSSSPTWLVSSDRQARSSLVGRSAAGPIPSSQL